MGRKTKEEEAKDYLASLGLDIPEELKGPIEIPGSEQMVVEFKEELYRQMRSGKLGQTALVNGLRALAVLAEASKQKEQAEEGPERGIDEILADAGLPSDRKREIGHQELQRLHARAAALELVVEAI